MRKKTLRRVGRITTLAVIWTLVLGGVSPAQAASTTSMSDTMSRLKISTASDHTIKFVTPTGVNASTDTITLTFAAGFTLASFALLNFDLAVGDSNNCSTATFTEKTLATSASTSPTWGVAQSGQVVTFTAPTNATTGEITADRCVRVEIGAVATEGGAGAVHITNGGTAGSTTVAIGGTLGDSGTLAVGITNDDRASVSASIDPSITFDLDSGPTATQGVENDGTHTVALGTLAAATLTTSGGSINSIFVDLTTNATFGASVTVVGANGGLKSTAADPDKTIDITGTEATIAAGTEGFGLCVESVAQTTGALAAGSQYDSGGSASNCTTSNGGTPTVGSVETTATEILSTGAEPIDTGRAEILVKVAISAATPAANDYSETLTFIATGTF